MRAVVVVALSLLPCVACVPEHEQDAGPAPSSWVKVYDGLDAALLSVWGTSSDDVWLVGGDDGAGPLVLHWDGATFRRRATGASGAMWWVRGGGADGAVWFSGDDGLVLRYDPATDAFTTLPTVGEGDLFGVLPFAGDDVWAVGPGDLARWDGAGWGTPAGLSDELVGGLQPYKLWGPTSSDVWIVGVGDAILRSQDGVFTRAPLPAEGGLFTVHGAPGLTVAVGGFIDGLLVESRDGAPLVDATARGMPELNSIHVIDDERAVAAGFEGAVWTRDADGWRPDDEAPPTFTTHHAAWVDEQGGTWLVGGNLGGRPLTGGTLYTKGVAGMVADAPFPSSSE